MNTSQVLTELVSATEQSLTGQTTLSVYSQNDVVWKPIAVILKINCRGTFVKWSYLENKLAWASGAVTHFCLLL